MFRRRSFLIGCSSLAAAPAFADGNLLSPAMDAAAPSLPGTPVSLGETETLALRIAGWDATGPAHAPDGGMWVHVSSSWQVAWR